MDGNSNDIDQAMLSVAKAAEYAGVSNKTIYRAVEDGRLRAARLCRGSKLQIRRTWVDDWIDASVVAPRKRPSYDARTARRQPRRGFLEP